MEDNIFSNTWLEDVALNTLNILPDGEVLSSDRVLGPANDFELKLFSFYSINRSARESGKSPLTPSACYERAMLALNLMRVNISFRFGLNDPEVEKFIFIKKNNLIVIEDDLLD